MLSPIDPSLLETLPAELRETVEAQIAALAAERAARLHLDAENADLRTRNAELAALNARLEHLAKEMKRARFGPRSEKLDADQLELTFEDLEAAMAEAQEEHDTATVARTRSRPVCKARTSRALPKELPREERVIEPESLTCLCGCGDMVRIGEDRSERLEITPAQFRVLEDAELGRRNLEAFRTVFSDADHVAATAKTGQALRLDHPLLARKLLGQGPGGAGLANGP